MPRIPTAGQRVSPRVVEGQRVSPESMTQVEKAQTQFGEALSDVGNMFTQKLREAREATERSNADVALLTAHSDLSKIAENTAYDPENPDAIPELYKKTMDKASQDTFSKMKEPNAVTSAKKAYDKSSIEWNNKIWSLSNKKQIDYNAASLSTRTAERVRNMDISNPQKTIKDALIDIEAQRQGGSITAQDAVKRGEDLHKEVVSKIANLAPSYEGAVEIIKAANLGMEETKALLISSKRFFDTNEATEKEQEAEAKETWENDAIEKLKTGKFTVDDITTAPKGVNREHWWDRLDKRNAAVIKGEKDPLTVTDFKTYAELSERCNTAPDTVTVEEIYSHVGKGETAGVSISDAEKLVNIRKSRLAKDQKPEDVLKTERSNRYQGMLKNLKGKNIFDGDETQNEIIYGQKANLLDSYLLANPDATDKQVEDYFHSLVAEEKSSWVGIVLDTFLAMQNLGGLAPLIPSGKKGGETEYSKTATNPETGEKMGWDGAKWQKID